MSKAPDNDLSLIHQLIQKTEGATALTGDLAALAAWLVSFAPDDAMKQLQFLFGTGRSLVTATATIALLDRLLAEPEEVRPRLRAFLDEFVDDGLQLVELIDWRLAQTREGAAPLFVLLALLARMGARTQPAPTKSVPTQSAPTSEVADDEPEAAPSAALYRLVDQASAQSDELFALIRWLLPFAPEDGVREVEVMKAMTRSYRLALSAVQSLDMLLSHPWRSPREYVSNDLSIVAVLIDYRVEKGRGEPQRLEEIKGQILKAQRLEIQAAARRQDMQDAWERQLDSYEEDVGPATPSDDDEPTSH